MNKLVPLISLRQPRLLGECPITAAVATMAEAGIEQRGAVFTRREVVDFILDLTRYTVDRPLHELRLLEPSFGGGDFLVPAVERLLSAWKKAGRPDPQIALVDSIRAVELHRDSFTATRKKVRNLLSQSGLDRKTCDTLLTRWLIYGDFLLVSLPEEFDIVVGNPPYVRQELIPDTLIAEYRSRYRTIYDRADIYVPFIERSLILLKDKGRLGFICSDRWMKNKYGGPLRALVAAQYHLKIFVDMVDTAAFHADVIAYPAITVITRDKPGPTRIAVRPNLDRKALSDLADDLLSRRAPAKNGIKEITDAASGSEPWILDASDQLALVRRLEQVFLPLEEAGCRVGIGVATGADKAFIGRYDELDVEPDRKLPLVMTRDIDRGVVAWRGLGVINPFSDAGRLVDLKNYPRLQSYLEERKDVIAGRHVAQKLPENWYRTIDRIYPDLVTKPKLLIPDIKGSAHIVYEEGRFYPHHNLYFITATDWNLHALQAVLMSGIARLFVSAYSTKMRGGFLRFQAQYLRRIRVPLWSDVPPRLRKKLISAAKRMDINACNNVVSEVYGLTEAERVTLSGECA